MTKWTYITIPAQKDYATQYTALHRNYKASRGSDGHVPRTTNRDVRELGHYWTKELVAHDEQVKRLTQRSAEKTWWREYNLSLLLANRNKPDARYSRNPEFWDAMRGISLQLNATAAVPGKAELVMEMGKELLDDVAEVALSGAMDVIPEIPKLADDVLDPVKDAGRTLAQVLKTGALITAGIVGAAIILPPVIRAIRKD